jgi:hypothetical protein
VNLNPQRAVRGGKYVVAKDYSIKLTELKICKKPPSGRNSMGGFAFDKSPSCGINLNMKGKQIVVMENGQYPISIQQTRKGMFTVRYGKQVDVELTYSRAAEILGASIMHALACDSKIEAPED